MLNTAIIVLSYLKESRMAHSEDFISFLKDINPSKSTIQEASRLHTNLRNYLKAVEDYSDIYTDSYLSGSYAKQTFIRPKLDSDGCDIDIVVETNHTSDDLPSCVLSKLLRTLQKRKCYQNSRVQSHSVGIDMANFHIDIVPLIKNQEGLMYIGSSRDETWSQTDPRKHISWSTQVNQEFEGNYKPLVKILKWWRRENCPDSIRFPKGITLEKMIADNLPDLGLPIEEQIMQTMANLATAYAEEIEACSTPFIDDPALSGNDLAAKYQYSDFLHFTKKLDEHLSLLADKGTGNSIWKEILGKNFPSGKSAEKHVSIIASASRKSALSVQHRQTLSYP